MAKIDGRPFVTSNSDTEPLYDGDDFTAEFKDGSLVNGHITAIEEDADWDENAARFVAYNTARGVLRDGREVWIDAEGLGHWGDVEFDVVADATVLGEQS